jgi:lysophospholipase L1-like esterase
VSIEVGQVKHKRSKGRSVLRWVIGGLGALVILVVLAGGGFIGWLYIQGHQQSPPHATYVAMGSSFASGAGLGDYAEGVFLCMRSASNYPHQVAAARHLVLADVTCSGATTGDVLHGGQYFQPAQIEAVTAATEVVTITVGGNDVSYLRNLYAWGCTNEPKLVTGMRKLLCNAQPQQDVDAALSQVRSKLSEIVDEVHRKAPKARVFLVDYLTIVPAVGDCPQLPLTGEQAETARSVAARLRLATAAAAAESHAELIQVSAMSEGHDVCASDTWMQPFAFDNGAIALHPNQEGTNAVANEIVKTLSKAPE